MSRWTRMERRGCRSTLRRMITGGAALLVLGGTAQAAVFASPPVYGGPIVNQGGARITCRIFNAGSAAVTLANAEIVTNTNQSVDLDSNTCDGALGGKSYCAYTAVITGNLAHSCLVRTVGTGVGALRGVGEVQRGGVILNAIPMK
jgi:hypothetical protein